VATKAKAFKCEAVKRSTRPNLIFAATLSRRGYWEEQVNLLRGDPDMMLKILASDPSSLMQLKNRAKKAGLALLFAREEEYLYIRAYIPSEEQTRLVLLLREPRTVNELRAKGLTMNLEAELHTMAQRGHAVFKKEKWQLTDSGKTALVERAG
jgi:hypothetical protein